MITLNMTKKTDRRDVHIYLPDGSAVELHVRGEGPHLTLEVMRRDTRPGSCPQWETVYSDFVRPAH